MTAMKFSTTVLLSSFALCSQAFIVHNSPRAAPFSLNVATQIVDASDAASAAAGRPKKTREVSKFSTVMMVACGFSF
jgi:hypothetical protein